MVKKRTRVNEEQHESGLPQSEVLRVHHSRRRYHDEHAQGYHMIDDEKNNNVVSRSHTDEKPDRFEAVNAKIKDADSNLGRQMIAAFRATRLASPNRQLLETVAQQASYIVTCRDTRSHTNTMRTKRHHVAPAPSSSNLVPRHRLGKKYATYPFPPPISGPAPSPSTHAMPSCRRVRQTGAHANEKSFLSIRVRFNRDT